MRRVAAAVSCLVVSCLAVTACSSPSAGSPPPAATNPAATAPTSMAPAQKPATQKPAAPRKHMAPKPTHGPGHPSTSPTPSPAQPPPAQPSTNPDDLVLAFAGDANAFKGGGASTRLGLGAAGDLLRAADLASVNLETALADDATGLTKQPKLYTFLTDRAFPEMLAREGVDVVSLANNHAMDYGVPGMERTLAIRQQLAPRLPMVGVGRTPDEAFAPVTLRAKGRTVIMHAGNDILESNMNWFPRDGKPGVAMVKTDAQFGRLVDGVRASRRAHPDAVIVVWMHWGIDYQVCTTRRQERRAQRLAEAGATVVVGTHAHRVQRLQMVGDTLVAHGLGNFNFSSDRVQTRETGVLTVRVPKKGAPRAEWAPGRIVDGRPVLLSGRQKDAALRRWHSLPGGC